MRKKTILTPGAAIADAARLSLHPLRPADAPATSPTFASAPRLTAGPCCRSPSDQLDELLSEILSLQQSQKRLGCRLDTLRDRLAILQLASGHHPT